MKKIITLIILILIPATAFAVKGPSRPPREAPDSIPAVFDNTTVVAGIHGYHFDRRGTLYLNESDVVATYKASATDKAGKKNLKEITIFSTPYTAIEKVLINKEARSAVQDGKLPTVPAGMWEYPVTVFGMATKQLETRLVISELRGKNQDAVVIIFKKDEKEISAVMHTLKNYGPAIKGLIEQRKAELGSK
ncbi:MAG: hypothetical protein ABH871_03605 [Pseudomonadota bacterium]